MDRNHNHYFITKLCKNTLLELIDASYEIAESIINNKSHIHTMIENFLAFNLYFNDHTLNEQHFLGTNTTIQSYTSNGNPTQINDSVFNYDKPVDALTQQKLQRQQQQHQAQSNSTQHQHVPSPNDRQLSFLSDTESLIHPMGADGIVSLSVGVDSPKGISTINIKNAKAVGVQIGTALPTLESQSKTNFDLNKTESQLADPSITFEKVEHMSFEERERLNKKQRVSYRRASGGSTRNGGSDNGSSHEGSASPQQLGFAVIPSEEYDTDGVASALSLLSAHPSYEASGSQPPTPRKHIQQQKSEYANFPLLNGNRNSMETSYDELFKKKEKEKGIRNAKGKDGDDNCNEVENENNDNDVNNKNDSDHKSDGESSSAFTRVGDVSRNRTGSVIILENIADYVDTPEQLEQKISTEKFPKVVIKQRVYSTSSNSGQPRGNQQIRTHSRNNLSVPKNTGYHFHHGSNMPDTFNDIIPPSDTAETGIVGVPVLDNTRLSYQINAIPLDINETVYVNCLYDIVYYLLFFAFEDRKSAQKIAIDAFIESPSFQNLFCIVKYFDFCDFGYLGTTIDVSTMEPFALIFCKILDTIIESDTIDVQKFARHLLELPYDIFQLLINVVLAKFRNDSDNVSLVFDLLKVIIKDKENEQRIREHVLEPKYFDTIVNVINKWFDEFTMESKTGDEKVSDPPNATITNEQSKLGAKIDHLHVTTDKNDSTNDEHLATVSMKNHTNEMNTVCGPGYSKFDPTKEQTTYVTTSILEFLLPFCKENLYDLIGYWIGERIFELIKYFSHVEGYTADNHETQMNSDRKNDDISEEKISYIVERGEDKVRSCVHSPPKPTFHHRGKKNYDEIQYEKQAKKQKLKENNEDNHASDINSEDSMKKILVIGDDIENSMKSTENVKRHQIDELVSMVCSKNARFDTLSEDNFRILEYCVNFYDRCSSDLNVLLDIVYIGTCEQLVLIMAKYRNNMKIVSMICNLLIKFLTTEETCRIIIKQDFILPLVKITQWLFDRACQPHKILETLSKYAGRGDIDEKTDIFDIEYSRSTKNNNNDRLILNSKSKPKSRSHSLNDIDELLKLFTNICCMPETSLIVAKHLGSLLAQMLANDANIELDHVFRRSNYNPSMMMSLLLSDLLERMTSQSKKACLELIKQGLVRLIIKSIDNNSKWRGVILKYLRCLTAMHNSASAKVYQELIMKENQPSLDLLQRIKKKFRNNESIVDACNQLLSPVDLV